MYFRLLYFLTYFGLSTTYAKIGRNFFLNIKKNNNKIRGNVKFEGDSRFCCTILL